MRISGVLRMLSTVVLLQWAAQEIALGEAAEGFGQRWTPQWFLTMGFLALVLFWLADSSSGSNRRAGCSGAAPVRRTREAVPGPCGDADAGNAPC